MFGIVPRRNNNVAGNVTNDNFFNAVDNFFNDDFFGNGFLGNSLMNMTGFNGSQFKVDVKENDNAYTIEAELPGVNKEDIGLDYDNGTLFIGVNHQEDINDNRNGYIHKERSSVSMQRSIYLGDININGIDAKLENGILTIVAPKMDVTPNRYKIDIK